MLFNSLEFLTFTALFFCLWPFLAKRNATRWSYLVVASAIFYGWWDWRFLGLILLSGLIDFYVGWAIEVFPNRKRMLLAISMVGNLGTLALFKYLGFFTRSVNALLAASSSEASIPVLDLTLPVGISFYTFQSMSYTIDIYRGQLKATKSILHFFAYLSLFPQLVAGPIIRATTLLPQLETYRRISEDEQWQGLRRIVAGFFKKVVIADNLAPVVTAAFSAETLESSGLYWWVITTMFAAQIYCDFSGYSDIAVGLAKWMGYDFPDNFRHPYIASSLRDFWQRWHISLSTWFRDYVYIPLGGSKAGSFMSYRNLMITMLLSGLWHGASWTFVIWGFIHALFMVVERMTKWTEKLSRIPGGRLAVSAIVLVQVLVAWVYFRAENLAQANAIVSSMLNPASFKMEPVTKLFEYEKQPLLCLAILILREFTCYFRINEKLEGAVEASRVASILVYAIVIALCVLFRGSGSAFIYFQF